MLQGCRLLIDLIDRALSEYVYDAYIAGLSYELQTASGGITLSVEGYNQKLGLFLRGILEGIKGFKADPKDFNILKQDVRDHIFIISWLRSADDVVQLKQQLENFSLSEPKTIGRYFCHYLLTTDRWISQERLDALSCACR